MKSYRHETLYLPICTSVKLQWVFKTFSQIVFFFLIYIVITHPSKSSNHAYCYIWQNIWFILLKVILIRIINWLFVFFIVFVISFCPFRRWAVVFSPMKSSSPMPFSAWMRIQFSRQMKWVFTGVYCCCCFAFFLLFFCGDTDALQTKWGGTTHSQGTRPPTHHYQTLGLKLLNEWTRTCSL